MPRVSRTVGLLLLFVLVSRGASSQAVNSVIAAQTAFYHPLANGALRQNWSNTGLINTDDDWSGVPSIIGYRGDGLTGTDNVDPQTVLAPGTGTPVDVRANETNPDFLSAGGVAEFEVADPTIAFQGSGTADAPFLLLYLNTEAVKTVRVTYTLRDLDVPSEAVQPVALHYRVGSAGNFSNVPAAYVANANDGGSTSVAVTLPAAVEGRPQVQVRLMTTNAAGVDAFIGVDDIVVSATADLPPAVTSTTPADGATSVALGANLTLRFSEKVTPTDDWFVLDCPLSGERRPGLANIIVSGGPQNYTLNPDRDFDYNETCVVTIDKNKVVDQDGAPDGMLADYDFNFTTIAQATATPTPTPQPTSTFTPTATPSPTPPIVLPTLTPLPTATPSATSSASSTATPTSTSSPIATPTATLSSPSTITPTATPSPSPTQPPLLPTATTTRLAPTGVASPPVLLHQLYLPKIVKRQIIAPDLIVKSLIVSRESITVAIQNIGTAPVADAFWVDVYVRPTSPPTAVNQTWSDLGDEGLVWGVTTLPLQTSQVVTLSIDHLAYRADLSHFTTPLIAKGMVFAQVDSVNLDSDYGGVFEGHELTGGVYNNINGTILPPLSIAAASSAYSRFGLDLNPGLPRRVHRRMTEGN